MSPPECIAVQVQAMDSGKGELVHKEVPILAGHGRISSPSVDGKAFDGALQLRHLSKSKSLPRVEDYATINKCNTHVLPCTQSYQHPDGCLRGQCLL